MSELQQPHSLDFYSDGKRQYVQVMPLRDGRGLEWLIVLVVPESDFMGQITANAHDTVLLSLMILGLAIALCMATARWLTRPILKMAHASGEMAHGQLSQHIAAGAIVELQQLANAFNSMAAQLREVFGLLEAKVEARTADLAAANAEISALNHKLRGENLRMGAELDVARRIQQMILPKPEELTNVSDLEIAGFMEPAEEVGGDYYDVLQTANQLVTIGIGDVTGHGLESGVLMLMTQTAVRTLRAVGEVDLVKALNAINTVLYQNRLRMDSYRNLSLALMDYQAGVLRICGQHEEILVVRADGTVDRVDTLELGYPVGMLADISNFVAEIEVTLAPGEGIVLYTDGIPEAENANREFYGMKRLITVVGHHWQQSAMAVRQAIVADMRSHIGDHHVYDDITLVVLKRRPAALSAASAD